MTIDRPFSDEDIATAIRQRDRALLDRVLESYGVPANVRAFYRTSVPGRTGKVGKTTEANRLKLARAKLRYHEFRQEGYAPDKAREMMMLDFPMHIETAVRLTDGDFPKINRLAKQLRTPTL